MMHGQGNLLIFLELQQEVWDPSVVSELREPLVIPQGIQVSIRVVRGSTGLLWNQDRKIRPLISKRESQVIIELQQ